jgi:predicted amidohydrolase
MTIADEVTPELPDAPTSAYALASRLLEHWRGRANRAAPIDRDDTEFDIWSTLVHDVAQRFDAGSGAVVDSDLAWIETTRSRTSDSRLWAHAVGWGLDLATWQTFAQAWHLGLGSPQQHQLTLGEHFPVGDWLPDLPDGSSRSVRPSAEVTNIEEFPHIRRWSPAQVNEGEPVEVEFRFDAPREVRAAAEASAACTLHPNGTDTEFDSSGTTSIYPVVPRPSTQGERIIDLLKQRSPSRPGLVVGGEVSLTEAVIAEVQAWLDASWLGPALAVVGSAHMQVVGEPANVAFALRRRADSLRHRKIEPFQASTSRSKQPVREGIVAGPRMITVWVSDWVRFSMLICRDVLDQSIRLAIGRAGVNLLAVPTYSDETTSYGVHVGSMALAGQGRVVLANNPTRFRNGYVNPVAIFGEPIAGREVRWLALDDPSSTGQGSCLGTLGKDPTWMER